MRSVKVLLVAHIALFSLVCSASDTDLPPPIKAAASQQGCKVKRCGELIEVSCRPEVDGPVTYFNNSNGAVLMRCGGACDSPAARSADPVACKSCPPKEWVACVKK
jgi:hypothetical protein